MWSKSHPGGLGVGECSGERRRRKGKGGTVGTELTDDRNDPLIGYTNFSSDEKVAVRGAQ